MKAYDSGLDVSRMLESNMVQMLAALEEIEDVELLRLHLFVAQLALVQTFYYA
ncbi:hypothetical protein RchiOBHm_Chr5g0014171 [Rosa chinensis]|uniref:Uncharacterized protein n=1 Tax=Rosa chinensis TaxID=74649 RepID=A0A2P6Q5N4_ROSCH|nr:hypothetical protein RchiOBHm_Chr5g0014171 [Rosa chinensis]